MINVAGHRRDCLNNVQMALKLMTIEMTEEPTSELLSKADYSNYSFVNQDVLAEYNTYECPPGNDILRVPSVHIFDFNPRFYGDEYLNLTRPNSSTTTFLSTIVGKGIGRMYLDGKINITFGFENISFPTNLVNSSQELDFFVTVGFSSTHPSNYRYDLMTIGVTGLSFSGVLLITISYLSGGILISGHLPGNLETPLWEDFYPDLVPNPQHNLMTVCFSTSRNGTFVKVAGATVSDNLYLRSEYDNIEIDTTYGITLGNLTQHSSGLWYLYRAQCTYGLMASMVTQLCNVLLLEAL